VSTLTRLIGEHHMAVVPITEGPCAGRFSVAFDFFGSWQFLADEESGEVRTWKTEYEAYHIGELSRQMLDELLGQVLADRGPRARPMGPAARRGSPQP
jgi:hypothetical protein